MDLHEVVCSELEPFAERTTVEGVNIILGARNAQNFSLALHELATNAAKYGALSNGSGTVKIVWTITNEGGGRGLKFTWRETGGPRVIAPSRHGFGTTLLKAIFADVRFDYALDGVTCEFDMLLDRVETGATTATALH